MAKLICTRDACSNGVPQLTEPMIREIALKVSSRAKRMDAAKMAALDRSQAIVEFALDGTIRAANANFLSMFGYSEKEVCGQHHSMFVDPRERNSLAYAAFWRSLKAGEFKSAEFRRIGKGGRSVWIQATYNPIMGLNGKPIKVVKFATDITRQTLQNIDFAGQIVALHKSQAVIEFDVDGNIITANDNFLSIFGYRLEEIRNKHHRMFVRSDYSNSAEYREFWDNMRHGTFKMGEYKRIAKDGRELYIQGTYNPIAGPDGTLLKIVKFATDVTDMVKERLRRVDVQTRVAADLDAIADAVARVNRQVLEAATASTQVHGDIRSVSAGAMELSAAASEISSEVTQASQIAGEAFEQAKRTSSTMGDLSDETTKIGEVISLIQSVAAQTNLLALNATIEAARAGEAGRGFTVVAHEVKQLATTTYAAAQQISAQIVATQTATSDAMIAIESIEGTIDALNGGAQSVSSKAERQAQVTREISSRMQTAEHGVRAIHEGVDAIANAIREIDQSAQMLRLASR